MNDFAFSAALDLQPATIGGTGIFSDILAVVGGSLPGLPLPDFFSRYYIYDARLESRKTTTVRITHPKNPKNSPQFIKTKPYTYNEAIILPQEVNDKLTKFAQIYFACRFTILFLEYIKNPNNRVLPVVGTTDELQKILVFYRDTPANLPFLDFRLKDAEKLCLQQLQLNLFRTGLPA